MNLKAGWYVLRHESEDNGWNFYGGDFATQDIAQGVARGWRRGWRRDFPEAQFLVVFYGGED